MVFINKKYGVRSMNGPLSDEAAKMICDLMDEKEEEQMSIQKTVTEETYNLIIDLYGEGHSYISELNRYSDASFYFDGVQFETIVAILNPRTQKWAFENLVKKEKKYYWKTKKTDRHGKPRLLAKDEDGAIYFIGRVMKLGHTSKITETELREWGYKPDMFDREEVE